MKADVFKPVHNNIIPYLKFVINALLVVEIVILMLFKIKLYVHSVMIMAIKNCFYYLEVAFEIVLMECMKVGASATHATCIV